MDTGSPIGGGGPSWLSDQPPLLSQGIDQLYYLQNMPAERLVFEPWLAASAAVRFYNSTRNIDIVRETAVRIYLDEAFSRPDWATAEDCPWPLGQCLGQPPTNSSFYPLPPSLAQLRDFRELSRSFNEPPLSKREAGALPGSGPQARISAG